ncbi:MAG: hypothetical protein IJY23_03400 [Clostridia bacterium]|nr:hypothetical protein [Clostridia bacterium]
MANIQINLNNQVKKIKPMHAGGQPPVTSDASDRYFHYMTEAGIPYSRLHDVGGAFGQGKYVDIPNIFRDFDADVNDPASYDFTFTDLLLEQLDKAKVEPYYRLGVTIENAAKVKSYWVSPPENYDKWASICEHIVRHYTKGWANGYHYKITYWEIWGEPDNPPYLWTGTPEDYYRLYEKTAKLIKASHPEVKVGGYGSTGFYGCNKSEAERRPMENHRIKFFRDFMKYVKEHKVPIDFFSWHSYAETYATIGYDNWLHKELISLGYEGLETHLNEWDPYAEKLGTGHHSAEIAAMMIAMQNGHPVVCCIYDMRTANAPYCPLFNPITHKPIHGYYSMVAFNTLYRLGTQVESVCDTDALYTLVASDGESHAMLISNLTGKKQELNITGVDLSCARYHVIDQERLLSWSPAVKEIENNQVFLIEW